MSFGLPAFVTTYRMPLDATVMRGSDVPEESASLTVLKAGAVVPDAVAGSAVEAKPQAATTRTARAIRRLCTVKTVRRLIEPVRASTQWSRLGESNPGPIHYEVSRAERCAIALHKKDPDERKCRGSIAAGQPRAWGKFGVGRIDQL